MRREDLTVEHEGQRLDQFLAGKLTGYSRSHLKGLVEAGAVTVDGRRRGADFKLKGGERVRVEFREADWAAEAPFEDWVLSEDAELLVLNKPAGLLIHPLGESWLTTPAAALSDQENLAGLLLRRRPEITKVGTPRCGIVHRLDRQTSGVLLVAKTPRAYESLTRGFKEREIHKLYRAIVRGVPVDKNSRVEAPIGRKPGHRKVMVTPFGKSAETGFRVLESGAGAALVEAEPLSGRTHQIRAHLAALGHPVAGDPEFETPGEEPQAPRLMLHAYRVRFAHPRTGKPTEFKTAPPKDFREFWTLCKGVGG